MNFFSIEHSRMAYRADFVLYGCVVVMLALYLILASPRALHLDMLTIAAVGMASWNGLEYLLHRFVLHGMPPFRRWHLRHHEQPHALICAPTMLSATLIGIFIFLPALTGFGLWRASALTWGVLVSYLAYSVTHHAIHHWRGESAWLIRRKRWHALHHHAAQATCYGVTSVFWDCVCGTAPTLRP